MLNGRLLATGAVLTTLLAALVSGVVGVTPAPASSGRSAKPIVTVIRHGGLCVSGIECRIALRIDDEMIAGDGKIPRRLSTRERLALLRAIRALDPAYLRSHPFQGTCPTAYDGS